MDTSYIVTMKLLPNPVRNVSVGDQFCNEQFPFDFERLHLSINEIHHCPFCGKGTVNSKCTCEEFARKLAKLQESVNDTKHKTKIHMDLYDNLLASGDNKVSIAVKRLTKQEVNDLGPGFWDNAQKLFDEKSNHSFLVSNIIYDGSKLDFTCKDLKSKAVFTCSLSGISYKNHKIHLGFNRRKRIPNGDNTYRTKKYWKNMYDSDWEGFCKKLRNI